MWGKIEEAMHIWCGEKNSNEHSNKVKKCKGTVMKKKNHSYSVTAIRIKISQLTETTEATGKTKSASTRMNFLTEITTREKVGEKRHLRRVWIP